MTVCFVFLTESYKSEEVVHAAREWCSAQWIFSSIHHCYNSKNNYRAFLQNFVTNFWNWCECKISCRSNDVPGSSEKQESKRFLAQVGVSTEIQEQGNAIDQTRRNRAVLRKVRMLSMFTYLCSNVFVKSYVCVKKKKCQVGEKYLSTGEENAIRQS